MKKRFFGTDGIRSGFGTAPLDQITVAAIGASVARWVSEARSVDQRPLRIVLGGDTRESTEQLAQWLIAGLTNEQPTAEILWGGVLPTPAVAYLTIRHKADLGIALSASHNPYHDNGIKFFDSAGLKLNDEAEAAIERTIVQHLEDVSSSPAQSQEPLPAVLSSMAEDYTAYLCSSLGAPAQQPLQGMTVVLDAGHGAASQLAEPVFKACGAQTHLLFAAPNGRNINDNCGSTAPELAATEATERGANIGFAFDGDADRVIVVDELGAVRDGDEILYLWANWLLQQGELDPPAIVATSMSNLGLEHALRARGVTVERCDVGDRAVVSMLRDKGLRLGGEQSGHIIDLARCTTGDGMLTALAIAAIVQSSGAPLSELLAGFEAFPQRLLNVRVASKPSFDSVPEIKVAARKVENELGAGGRLVLRYSGTEPLARVMIEAADAATVDRLCEELAAVIRVHLS